MSLQSVLIKYIPIDNSFGNEIEIPTLAVETDYIRPHGLKKIRTWKYDANIFTK